VPDVFVSIGSNIDRERNVVSALKALEEHFGRLSVSSFYESDAVGFEGDPFFNLVVSFSTPLSVGEVVHQLADIERRHGRARESRKFSARTLDLDLLLYGDEILHVGKLRLPREEITRYAFMLEPLAELAPARRHPMLGLTYAELWAAFDKRSVGQRRLNLFEAPS